MTILNQVYFKLQLLKVNFRVFKEPLVGIIKKAALLLRSEKHILANSRWHGKLHVGICLDKKFSMLSMTFVYIAQEFLVQNVQLIAEKSLFL